MAHSSVQYACVMALLMSSCRSGSFLKQRYTHFSHRAPVVETRKPTEVRHTTAVRYTAAVPQAPPVKQDEVPVTALALPERRTYHPAQTSSSDIRQTPVAGPFVSQAPVSERTVKHLPSAAANVEIRPMDPGLIWFLVDLFCSGGQLDGSSLLISLLVTLLVLLVLMLLFA
jgi:hypothetical protein